MNRGERRMRLKDKIHEKEDQNMRKVNVVHMKGKEKGLKIWKRRRRRDRDCELDYI